VHDVPVVRASQRSTYERLLAAGVRIWEYQPSMMHSKTMLVDDWLCMVGSTNLDAPTPGAGWPGGPRSSSGEIDNSPGARAQRGFATPT
jgi:hypothetical protein